MYKFDSIINTAIFNYFTIINQNFCTGKFFQKICNLFATSTNIEQNELSKAIETYYIILLYEKRECKYHYYLKQ